MPPRSPFGGFAPASEVPKYQSPTSAASATGVRSIWSMSWFPPSLGVTFSAQMVGIA
jgi:hypothetical protein